MRSLPLSQFIIGVFSLLIFLTSIHSYGGVSEYGAGFMPTLLSGLLFFFTAIDGGIQWRKRTSAELGLSRKEWLALLMVTVAISLFVLLLDVLGFWICAIALLFALMMMRRRDKPLFSLLFAVATASIIYYVFATILMVDLPSGPLL